MRYRNIRMAPPWFAAVALMLAVVAGSAQAAVPAGQLPSLAPVLKEASPAVVNIRVRGTQAVRSNPLFNDPMFRRFFDVPEQPQEREFGSVGSGVVIDSENGYLVTNAHVVANADEIVIQLNDQREFEAELVGSDPEADVALLKVDTTELADLDFGNSDNLEIGDFVIAVGNPFGLGQTATVGIVSAVGRAGRINQYENYIQTDASINPGNSGGALINQRGELVGINTAILSRSGGNNGIGFAIPANMVSELVDQIIQFGEVKRGQLGVFIQDLTPEIAELLDIDAKRGALISNVVEDSPAEEAGIRAEDVIVSVDGKPVSGGNDLRNKIGLKRPGDSVKVDVVRDGREREFTIKLAARDAIASTSEPAEIENEELLEGVTVQNIPNDHPQADDVEGVMVTAVDPRSRAARGGLQSGDLITSVNRQRIDGVRSFREALEELDSDSLLLNIRRGPGAQFIVIR